MMIFYYCPILGLTYYYSESTPVILEFSQLEEINSLSIEEYFDLAITKGVMLVDSVSYNNLVEYLHRIISNF